MDELYIAFKGKNNTSNQLLSLLPASDKVLLTNSFSGLRRDISKISFESFRSVVMFGIDKALVDSVRIERNAMCKGENRDSTYDIPGLMEKLDNQEIAFTVSETPTQYLCNEAYFCVLEKCLDAVFIHIPSLRGMTPELMGRLVGCFSV